MGYGRRKGGLKSARNASRRPFALISLLVAEEVSGAVNVELDGAQAYIDATLTLSLLVGAMFVAMWVVQLWAPEFGFPPTPEKNELVLSIKMGCADTVPFQSKPNTPF